MTKALEKDTEIDTEIDNDLNSIKLKKDGVFKLYKIYSQKNRWRSIKNTYLNTSRCIQI